MELRSCANGAEADICSASRGNEGERFDGGKTGRRQRQTECRDDVSSLALQLKRLVVSALYAGRTGRREARTVERHEVDLCNQAIAFEWFPKMWPQVGISRRAKVGGIVANDTLRAEFIYDNIAVAANVAARAAKRSLTLVDREVFQAGLISGLARGGARIWRSTRLSQRIRRRKL